MYERDGTLAHGRPVYKERRKFDRQPYDTSVIVPAEIRYCADINSWVFVHEHIRKSADDSGCNWLLRSAETDEFDLLNVDGSWKVWVGVIDSTEVSVSCNICSENTDCNLNGQCVDGSCKCFNDAGAQFLGTHCETRLSVSCKSIIGEGGNETFSVQYYSESGGKPDTLFQEYSRPVYSVSNRHVVLHLTFFICTFSHVSLATYSSHIP